MVAAVRRGASLRSVASRFRVALCTVQRWVERARGRRLDRVDWSDRPRTPQRTTRTDPATEQRVLTIRRWLKERSVLGEYGAAAIARHMEAQGIEPPPSLRTIGRILQRRGALDHRRRIRRPPPPRAWYLPDVAARLAELDDFDTIEGLAIRGGPHLTVLTGISLHGGLPEACPQRSLSAQAVVERLVEHWHLVGLPAYAQFDNDQRFTGPRQYADTIGRVTRLCLSLGVIPVFVPPNEMGFQAAIEGFNSRWQAKVWSRFRHHSIPELQTRSARYILAARQRGAARIETAPPRRPFPIGWRLNLQQPPHGKIVYLRRTNDTGCLTALGHSFLVDPHWLHRLVRAEVDLDAHVISFYALRRREPSDQPLLRQLPYTLPQRPFKQ